MAHLDFEWVKRRQVSFGTTTGETLVVGEPVDVGDWEELALQITTLGVEGSPTATDIVANVQTAISVDEYPGWENCLATATTLSYLPDGWVVLKVTPSSQHGLRKWARLVLQHGTTTAAQKITINARCLLKKRTP